MRVNYRSCFDYNASGFIKAPVRAKSWSFNLCTKGLLDWGNETSSCQFLQITSDYSGALGLKKAQYVSSCQYQQISIEKPQTANLIIWSLIKKNSKH